LIRFPGGGYNAGNYAAEKQLYKLLLQEKGYYFADWNSLNGDAEGGTRSAEQLVARIRQTSGPKNLVILMHDAATKKSTAEALPAIIEYLKGEGYVFRRLDEIKYYGGTNVRPVPDMEM
jgi:peptidoglycan/xylan/chitin deacetylase (PgdA/CDA1 family)